MNRDFKGNSTNNRKANFGLAVSVCPGIGQARGGGVSYSYRFNPEFSSHLIVY